MQPNITAAGGREGVARSGVKPTANPSVTICVDPPRYGFCSPPGRRTRQSVVLVSVFSVADIRRRQTYRRVLPDTHGITCLSGEMPWRRSLTRMRRPLVVAAGSSDRFVDVCR
ncbi:DUF5958 family protein [Streptomyces sp. NPDC046324]|uniref:DUF5958 family protein n=1 Tax=Streptomyces sp. NPDC046324 TaxID=3154915 RepID=UPI00340A7067